MTRIVAKQQSQSNALPPGEAQKTLRSDTPRSQIRIRVLILEDNESDAALMVRALEQSGMLPEWERVETEPDFTARLTPAPDLILSDYALPQFSGMQALRLVRSSGLDVPFILVSGSIGEDAAVEAVRQGADDYLLKDRMARLGPAVLQALEKRKLRLEKESADAARKASEGLYRNIFEGAAEGILLSTPDGFLLAANLAAATMLGYASPDELESSVTNPGHRLFADADARRILVERVRQNGEVRGYETRGLRRDGSPIWVTLSARLVHEPGGTSRMLTLISDISERRRADEVRASLAAIVENSNDAIIGRALDGTITSWNTGAERLLGHSAGDVIGRPISFMLPPGQLVRTAEINEKMLRGEAIPPHETRRATKDGRLIDVLSSISPIKDSDGNVIGASHILQDITAVKRAEETRALLASIVESSDDAIVSRTLDGTVLSWNAGAERIFGYTAAEMVGHSVSVLSPPGSLERSRHNTEALLRGEFVPPFDTVRLAKGERRMHVQITVSAVRDSAGHVAAISAIFRDITQRVLSDRRRAMEHAVTKVLAESETVDTTMPKLISTMCEAMDWAYGARWAWSEAEQRLCRFEYWSSAEPDFDPSDRDYWLKLGGGGPGGLLRRAWLAGETTWYEDIDRDPTFRRKASCRKLGLRSAYCFPILDGAKVIGVMEFFGREPRDPDPVMPRITEAVGSQIGQFIRRKQAESERAALAIVVEQSNDAIVTRALDGTIVSWNASAERMFGYTAAEAIGQPITIIVPPERHGTFRPFIDRVIAGETLGAVESFHRHKNDSRIMTSVALSPIRNEAGEVVSVSLSFRDITEVRRLLEESRRRVELTHLLDALARAANEAGSLEEAMRRCLEQICNYGRWTLGRVGMFRAGQEGGIPQTVCWHTADPARFAEFISISDKTEYTATQGQFIGNVMREMRPVWLSDLTQLPVSSRMGFAARCGLRSAFAFPVIVHKEVAAFMECFGEDVRAPDGTLLELIVQVSSQLARLIERERAVAALRESEERLRAMFEQAGVGIGLRSLEPRNPRWLRVNQKLCDIFGYSEEELLRLTTVDLTPPDERGLAIDFNEKLRTGELTSYSREKRYMSKDGRIIWANISLAALRGAEGSPTHVISVIQDITERKLQEQKIEKLIRVRAVSSSINSTLVRVRDRQELFQESCRIAVEAGQFPIAWIGALDPETQDVTPIAWSGEHVDELMKAKSSARDDTPRGMGAVGRAIRERRAVINNDIAAKQFGGPRVEAILRLGFRSQITLPLFEDTTLVGTLTIYAREPNFFDEEELKLLTELAGDVSFALESMSKQQKLDKLARIRAVSSGINAANVRIREREALLRETCRIAVEYGKFEMVWIALVDQEKQQIKPVAWNGFSSETAQAVTWASISAPGVTLSEVMRTRRIAVRNDIEAAQHTGVLRQEALKRGFRSTVCLPFVVDEKLVAAMILFAAGRDFFVEDELALLNEMAGNISFALENIARQEKIERLTRIRTVLGEINAAIVRVRSKQELFEEACRIAVEAGRFPFAWIGVVDGDAKQLSPIAWAGEEERYLDPMRRRRSLDGTLSLQGGPAVTAVREKKAVIANDIRNDPQILRREEHLERNINSLAVLPLLVSDEAVGMLALHAREIGFFDEEEMKLLSELAGDIALALQTIEKQEKLEYLSYYDTLTGLPNRTLFVDRAGQQMRSRGGEPLIAALILLDLERFRNINESFGRHGGDELLKQVARRLEMAFNGKDYLARVGADVFGIVIRGIRDAAAAVHAVENQVLGCFREPFRVGDSELRVAARAGIALHPADGGDADTLFSNAEAALKKAGNSGEHYLFYAADMNARAAQMLSLETRLRKAVEAQQFVLHYQPKINLSNDGICGLEALIRWNDPESGLVPPGTFIPLLEETGLILEVGKWALAQALTDHREWTARGCAVPAIAVNVSAIQLQRTDFTETVIGVLQQGGGKPEALELEITESLLMKDVEASIRKLSILRGLGIHIAMDDFGTGYSSLSYIARLPINSVKIDRSFINGMAKSPQDMGIVTTIIALAHSLNLRVVAEGVETGEQSQLLKLLKCDEAQGFLFSKPLPPGQIEALLRERAPPE